MSGTPAFPRPPGRRFALAALCLLLTAAGAAAAAPEEGTARVLGLRAPTTVAAVVARLGKPESVTLSDEGRRYRWRLPHDAGTVAALADDAADEPDPGATVSSLEHSAGRAAAPTIFGFTFHKTRKRDVEARFRGKLRGCGGNFKARRALSLFEDPGFVFFFFSPSGRLIGVSQSDVNLDAAD